jgi:hypothetical protein
MNKTEIEVGLYIKEKREIGSNKLKWKEQARQDGCVLFQ